MELARDRPDIELEVSFDECLSIAVPQSPPEWRFSCREVGREPIGLGRGLFQFRSLSFSQTSTGESERSRVSPRESDRLKDSAGETEPGLKEVSSKLVNRERDD